MEIINLIGADACGKDTQIALMKKYFEEQKKVVQVISIWDSLIDFSSYLDKNSLQKIVDVFLLKFEPHARSFFLLSCLKNSFAKIRYNSDVVILNGFYHKYWASELSYGLDNDLWKNNMSYFSQISTSSPLHKNIQQQKYIYLETNLDICKSRRNQWSKYEQGLAPSLNQQVKDLQTFQTELHKNLQMLVKDLEKIESVAQINGNQSQENVFQDILKFL